jgi:hypothetical protein
MQSLTEGIKFVFNNKTVLELVGQTSPYYLVVQWLLPVFFTRYFKGWIRGIWFFKSSSSIDLLTMLITAYVPLSRNAGMKLLTAIFGFGICIIVFGSTIFWVSLAALFFEWCFDGISVVIRQTILQLKPQIICVAEWLL